MAFNLAKLQAVIDADPNAYEEVRKAAATAYAHLAVDAAGKDDYQAALSALDKVVELCGITLEPIMDH